MKNSFKFLALSLTLLITFAWNYPASPKKVYEHWLGHIERMANPSTITIFDDQGLNPLTLSQGVENSTGHKRLFWMDPAMLNLNSEEVNLLTVLDEVTTANGKKLVKAISWYLIIILDKKSWLKKPKPIQKIAKLRLSN